MSCFGDGVSGVGYVNEWRGRWVLPGSTEIIARAHGTTTLNIETSAGPLMLTADVNARTAFAPVYDEWGQAVHHLTVPVVFTTADGRSIEADYGLIVVATSAGPFPSVTIRGQTVRCR